MKTHLLGLAAAALSAVAGSHAALAWNAHGHRVVTRLALETTEGTLPAWALTPEMRERIAYQSNEADRFRGTKLPTLEHENSPDHYIDVDMLEFYGVTLETLSPLRHEYVKQFDAALKENPRTVDPQEAPDELLADPSMNFPGFGMHAVAEHYAKLVSCFNTARILEGMDDPSRAQELEQARANVVYHMGMLSHFVGDLAQPLHTTMHFNGWIGINPGGFTREKTFHAYIDGGVVKLHGLDDDAVRPLLRTGLSVNPTDPWRDLVAYVQTSFGHFETLYVMQRTGDLDREPGKALITGRLADGASMLGAMYRAAWAASEPTDEQAARFIRYDESARPAGMRAKPESEASGG